LWVGGGGGGLGVGGVLLCEVMFSSHCIVVVLAFLFLGVQVSGAVGWVWACCISFS
jgi:hypothetical protein